MTDAERLVEISADEGGRDPDELNEITEWGGIDAVVNDRKAIRFFFDTVEDRDALILRLPELKLLPSGREGHYSESVLALDVQDERDPSGSRRRDGEPEEAEVPPELEAWRTAGLPAFEPTGDRTSLTVTFDTERERDAVAARFDLQVAKRTHGTISAWWPPRAREDLSSLRFEAEGAAEETGAWKMETVYVAPSLFPDLVPDRPYRRRRQVVSRVGSCVPRYPVYVPSRNRWHDDRRLTIKALLRDDVPFRVVVVPSEVDSYEPVVGTERLLVLPGDEMVLKDSRNWIRDHAEAEGHDRHWQLDDNILEFRRLWHGRRIPCNAGVALRVCEDLSDLYENVAISGLNYQMFVPAETPIPFYRNVHVYSASLICHAMPYRWRLVYNDDTDICLQALDGGWCTLLVNAFMANKMRTMTVSGGNTNALYEGDGRLTMARVLEAAWPGTVKTRWRFGRPQHVVRWDKFTTELRSREDATVTADYGLALRAVREVQSPALRRLLAA